MNRQIWRVHMKKKLAAAFCAVGVMFGSGRRGSDLALFSAIGITCISIAYMPWLFSSSLFFGIGGGMSAPNPLLQHLGFFFLAMAVYNLCPFMGGKCFALQPEKMIRYGLQNDEKAGKR
jgi:hypothetical protein